MAQTRVNNGVNVEALLEARKALAGAPEAAKFKGALHASGRTALTVRLVFVGFTASARNNNIRPSTLLTPIIRKSSHPRILV